jgi:hypothetical protein
VTDEVIGYYQDLLADRWDLGEAVCLTYAYGIDEDGLIRAFGGDPADTAPRSLVEAGAELSAYHYSEVPATVLVAPIGDWLLGLEYNGFQGSRPEVLRAASGGGHAASGGGHAASGGGRALSVFWNINGHETFCYAVGGRTVLGFDLTDPDRRHGADPSILDGQLAGLPFGYEDGRAAGLALIERVSGARLTRSLLDGVFRRAVLRWVPEDLVPESLVGHPALDEPFLAEVLGSPTADKLPAITRYVLDLVVRAAGIEELPLVRRGLSARPGEPGLERLRDDLADLAEHCPPGRNRIPWAHGVRAVAEALGPDPGRACAEVNFRAGYVLSDRGQRVQQTVLQRCAKAALRPAPNRP